MTLFNCNDLLKPLSTETVILGVTASPDEFWGNTILSIAWSELPIGGEQYSR